MKLVLVLVLVLAPRTYAEPPTTIGVDVQDLPPLPPAEGEVSSSALVVAATAAEEDVVVGAATREQTLGNVASAVTVVSGDRIRRFGYRSVGEAVAAVAGAYLEDNRLVQSLGIRGLNIPGDYNTRVLVLVDGATVNEAWGSFAGVGFDTFVSIDDVARIEVIRGPVSSLYGANAFFGIINIVTRSAAETPRAWGKTSLSSIGGTVTSAGFATGGVHQQVRGTVQVADRFGETTSLAGVGDELKSDGEVQYAASLVASAGGSFVQVRAYKQHRDTPFAPYNGDPAATRPYRQTNTQLMLEGGHTHQVTDRFTITARAYANLYEFTDHIIQIDMPPFDDIGDGSTYGAELRGRYELVPDRLGLTAGTEASYYQTNSKSFTETMEDQAAEVPKNFNIEGLYAELDGQPQPWLGFTAGVRYDRNSVIDTRTSPRAALFLAKREKYGLKLLYAQGFRNPSAYEAFFYDNTSFSQPVNLRAEQIRSYEAVLWAKPAPGLSLRLSGFLWDATGVVEQLPDPNNMALLQFQNAARFVTQGIEAEGSYRTGSGWYAFGGGAYSKVGSEDDMGALQYGGVVNAPAWTGAFGVSTPKLGGLVHVSTELLAIGERGVRPDADGNPLPNAPAWYGWNWALYAPNVGGFEVTAGVRNVIGTRDQVVAPGDYDRTVMDPITMMPVTTVVPTVPGEGREVYVKVGYSY